MRDNDSEYVCDCASQSERVDAISSEQEQAHQREIVRDRELAVVGKLNPCRVSIESYTCILIERDSSCRKILSSNCFVILIPSFYGSILGENVSY